MNTNPATQSKNNYDLKNTEIDLIGVQRSRPMPVRLEDLEALRIHGNAIPASKHGLEVICGASCETGAQ